MASSTFALRFSRPGAYGAAISLALSLGACTSTPPSHSTGADSTDSVTVAELSADPTTSWPDSSGGSTAGFALQIGNQCFVPDAPCQGAVFGLGGAALAFNVANAAASCDMTIDAFILVAVCQVGGGGPEDPLADACAGAAAFAGTTAAKNCVARALSTVAGVYSIFKSCYKECPHPGSGTAGAGGASCQGQTTRAGSLACSSSALASGYYELNACVQGGGGASCFTTQVCAQSSSADRTCDGDAMYACLCGGGGLSCFSTKCGSVNTPSPPAAPACEGQSTSGGKVACDSANLMTQTDALASCVNGGGGTPCFAGACGGASADATCDLDTLYSCLCGGGGSACIASACVSCGGAACN